MAPSSSIQQCKGCLIVFTVRATCFCPGICGDILQGDRCVIATAQLFSRRSQIIECTVYQSQSSLILQVEERILLPRKRQLVVALSLVQLAMCIDFSTRRIIVVLVHPFEQSAV